MSEDIISNQHYIDEDPDAFQDINDAHELALNTNELETDRVAFIGGMALLGEAYAQGSRESATDIENKAMDQALESTRNNPKGAYSYKKNAAHATGRIILDAKEISPGTKQEIDESPINEKTYKMFLRRASEQIASIDEDIADTQNSTLEEIKARREAEARKEALAAQKAESKAAERQNRISDDLASLRKRS